MNLRRNGLLIAGLILIVLGVFDWGPAELSLGYVEGWGSSGSDRAMLGGVALVATALAMRLIELLRPPTK